MGWLGERKGCTWFPDGNYRSCCDEHDDYYRTGIGSRLRADRKLKECVTRAGHPWKARLMYIGVRMFGWLRWKGK